MNPNPFASLLHSRKFWLLILDTVVSLVVFFVTAAGNPALLAQAQALIAILQPVFVAIITAITLEDNAAVRAQATVDAAKVTAAGTVSVAKVEGDK